jgi:type I restriction enzyme, S subunit
MHDVLLGYLCVLISPKKDFILGKYLNTFLHSSYVQKYFEVNASVSSQRYTPSDSIIKNIMFTLFSIADLKLMGDFFLYR